MAARHPGICPGPLRCCLLQRRQMHRLRRRRRRLIPFNFRNLSGLWNTPQPGLFRRYTAALFAEAVFREDHGLFPESLSTKGNFHAIIPVINHTRGCHTWVRVLKNNKSVPVCWPMCEPIDENHAKHPQKHHHLQAQQIVHLISTRNRIPRAFPSEQLF